MHLVAEDVQRPASTFADFIATEDRNGRRAKTDVVAPPVRQKTQQQQHLASLWCVNLVSLEASDKDKQHGVDSVVMYDDVLQSLAFATTDFVDFRYRLQRCDRLKNMFIALVSKGINLYLCNVAAKQGKGTHD